MRALGHLGVVEFRLGAQCTQITGKRVKPVRRDGRDRLGGADLAAFGDGAVPLPDGGPGREPPRLAPALRAWLGPALSPCLGPWTTGAVVPLRAEPGLAVAW